MKIEDIAIGDLVVMEHPAMDHTVIAQITGRKQKMVNVLYWTPRGLSDEPKARNIKAILGKLKAGRDPLKLTKFLIAAHDNRTDAKREADKAYHSQVKSIMED